MNYTVVWTRRAEDALLSAWMESNDKPAIVRAAQEVDRRLGCDPTGEGEARETGWRVVISMPLVAKYSVSEADKRVTVSRVRVIPPRGAD